MKFLSFGISGNYVDDSTGKALAFAVTFLVSKSSFVVSRDYYLKFLNSGARVAKLERDLINLGAYIIFELDFELSESSVSLKALLYRLRLRGMLFCRRMMMAKNISEDTVVHISTKYSKLNRFYFSVKTSLSSS